MPIFNIVPKAKYFGAAHLHSLDTLMPLVFNTMQTEDLHVKEFFELNRKFITLSMYGCFTHQKTVKRLDI